MQLSAFLSVPSPYGPTSTELRNAMMWHGPELLGGSESVRKLFPLSKSYRVHLLVASI
jgi:hypothetical protein